jgi:hypothetical protein
MGEQEPFISAGLGTFRKAIPSASVSSNNGERYSTVQVREGFPALCGEEGQGEGLGRNLEVRCGASRIGQAALRWPRGARCWAPAPRPGAALDCARCCAQVSLLPDIGRPLLLSPILPPQGSCQGPDLYTQH